MTLPKNYDLNDLLSEKKELEEKLASTERTDTDRETQERILMHKIERQGATLNEKLANSEKLYEEAVKQIYKLRRKSKKIKEKCRETYQTPIKEIDSREDKSEKTGIHEMEITMGMSETQLKMQDLTIEEKIKNIKSQLQAREDEILDLKERIKENADLLNCIHSKLEGTVNSHKIDKSRREGYENTARSNCKNIQSIQTNNHCLNLQVNGLLEKESALLSENIKLKTQNKTLALQLRSEMTKKSKRYRMLKLFSIDLLIYLPLV